MEVGFAQDYDELVLMDASDPDLRAALDSGSPLYFKGGLEQDIVLCTHNSTFSVFSRETTNELLLLQPSENYQIQGRSLRIFEPLKIPPRLEKVESLLKPHHHDKRVKLDFDTILNQVQASAEELHSALMHFNAVEDEEMGWTLPTLAQQKQVYDQFLLSLQANMLTSCATVNSFLAMEWLDEFSPKLVKAILFANSEVVDEARIVRFQGEHVLREVKRLDVHDFLHEWQESVSPLEIRLTRESIALFLKDCSILLADGNELVYFPRDALPAHAKLRCDALFALQPFWLEQDLEYFLDKVEGGIPNAISRYCKLAKSEDGTRGGYIQRAL